jgi:hypothetical protein
VHAGPDNAKRVDVIDTLYPEVISISASHGSCARDPYDTTLVQSPANWELSTPAATPR